MDIAEKTKAENWDYYQEMIKSSGFSGITELVSSFRISERQCTELTKQNAALAAENERLEAVIKAAHEQEPVAVMYKTGGALTRDEVTDKEVFEICCRVETPLYRHPVPAQAPVLETNCHDCVKIKYEQFEKCPSHDRCPSHEPVDVPADCLSPTRPASKRYGDPSSLMIQYSHEIHAAYGVQDSGVVDPEWLDIPSILRRGED